MRVWRKGRVDLGVWVETWVGGENYYWFLNYSKSLVTKYYKLHLKHCCFTLNLSGNEVLEWTNMRENEQIFELLSCAYSREKLRKLSDEMFLILFQNIGNLDNLEWYLKLINNNFYGFKAAFYFGFIIKAAGNAYNNLSFTILLWLP